MTEKLKVKSSDKYFNIYQKSKELSWPKNLAYCMMEGIRPCIENIYDDKRLEETLNCILKRCFQPAGINMIYSLFRDKSESEFLKDPIHVLRHSETHAKLFPGLFLDANNVEHFDEEGCLFGNNFLGSTTWWPMLTSAMEYILQDESEIFES